MCMLCCTQRQPQHLPSFKLGDSLFRRLGTQLFPLNPHCLHCFRQRRSISMTFEARVVHVVYFCSLMQHVSCESPAISLQVIHAACVKFHMDSTWSIAPVERLMTLYKVANHQSVHPAHRSFSVCPSLPVMPHGTEMNPNQTEKSPAIFIIDHSFAE